jgi:spore maturation protein A
LLNYIWAGLIVLAVGVACWHDAREWGADPYRNGLPLPVTVEWGESGEKRAGSIRVRIAREDFTRHYGTEVPADVEFPATVSTAGEAMSFRVSSDTPLPSILDALRKVQNDGKELRGALRSSGGDDRAAASVVFEPARLTRLRAVTSAAFTSARDAVDLVIRLIGGMALWLGMMKIAEASGLVSLLVLVVQPLLRPLFPQIPRGHPAMGMIALNLSANMLGLGNAATPMGIKAMEELQKLNSTEDTATDPMVMLLALNTAGVQLLPSATLVAVLGAASAGVFVPMLIVTFLCAVLAAVSARILSNVGVFARTRPADRVGEGEA